jgi:hypothetical protein
MLNKARPWGRDVLVALSGVRSLLLLATCYLLLLPPVLLPRRPNGLDSVASRDSLFSPPRLRFARLRHRRFRTRLTS